MNSIEIHTKRLVLRPLSLTYLETVYQYASDIENTKYMVHLPSENIEETSVFLHRVEDEWSKEEPEFFEFAIIYENNQIGAVSVSVENGVGELGWIINKKYWNQGFAYESALALIDFAKQRLGLTYYIAHCDAENIGSYRVMEKLGMVRTGEYGGRLDSLTGLYNRSAFEKDIRILGKRKRYSVIVMDLNDFKKINDTFGHDYGDAVLKRVAATIRESFDHNGRSYRIGGDEFSVLSRGSDLQKIIHQLKSMTSRLTMERQKDSTLPTVAYGYSTSQMDVPDIQAALNAADAQMYLNKEQQKKKKRISEK